ncbi:Uncharacterised protein [Bordetella pertussis]|nr:Uncharacterised protein [Bordetella pertussis]CFW39816.1 Uncharacterised protein [Bordetella pertussis]
MTPASSIVGTSGRSGERLGEVTASARSLPALICARAAGRLSIAIGTMPAITSVSAALLPL